MSFLWIHFLWLLLLVPVLVIVYILAQRRPAREGEGAAPPTRLEPDPIALAEEAAEGKPRA